MLKFFFFCTFQGKLRTCFKIAPSVSIQVLEGSPLKPWSATSLPLRLHLLTERLKLLLLQFGHHFVQGVNLCPLSLLQFLLRRFVLGLAVIPSVRGLLLLLLVFAARWLHDDDSLKVHSA